jgi:DNA invertase Pin-like site-specific DNA recombinase
MNSLINTLSSIDIKNNTVIYTRCSTKNQDNPIYNSTSLDSQIFTCTNFCKEHNLNIIETFKEICSARKSSNQKVLLDIINTHTNIIIVIFDISRFSRNLFDGIQLIKICFEKKISIYFVKENISLCDFKDIHQFTMGLINSQSESDAISYRIQQSYKYRKSLGIYYGKEKYGYDIYKDGNFNKLKINKNEQLVIELIMKLKFGCSIENLFIILTNILNSVPKEDLMKSLNITNEQIIMYGNYNNIDIAHFLNNYNILHKETQWTNLLLSKVIVNNYEYVSEREQMVSELKEEFIKLIKTNDKNKIIRSIKILYEKLNGYKLSNNLSIYNDTKCDFDIVIFFNVHKVNFRIWTYEDLFFNKLNNKRLLDRHSNRNKKQHTEIVI